MAELRKLVFYAKVSKQSDRLIIIIPPAVRPLAQQFHRKKVKVTVEVVE